MSDLEFLVSDLPSPDAARRFFEQFSERAPAAAARLQKSKGILSDVLTLASYSPLLAATLIQNPEYAAWLGRKRADSVVRNKDELLESLARFSLTNSQIDVGVLFARFRRRELLRIFLRDIRRLGTIAEITEEISNLADAILEHALRLARQEMDNRYGAPFEIDEKGRQRPSGLSIVSLGKLGSKELNYSSDIDLLFIYSADGSTTGNGSRGTVTNREYFVKLAEYVTQLLSRQSGEGAAYRVDMRLRPNGRVGALALSLKETIKYYLHDARAWEQQVLIRSRASAGSSKVFKAFIDQVRTAVFKPGREPSEALRGVYLSKEKIDHEHRSATLFNVKVGQGGIREIEFIAQALQLAYGGEDPWLRVPHTLISIARLADRDHISREELSELSSAYEFLRRLEHILQMEHGLQTHSVPSEPEKLDLIASKMGCSDRDDFDRQLAAHTGAVHEAFLRVFGEDLPVDIAAPSAATDVPNEVPELPSETEDHSVAARTLETRIITSLERSDEKVKVDKKTLAAIRRISEVSPKFAEMIASMPRLASHLHPPDLSILDRDHSQGMSEIAVETEDRSVVLNRLRVIWSELYLEIGLADIYQIVAFKDLRRLQTALAESSINAALKIAIAAETENKRLSEPAVLALGKLGSGTLDYDSDLDLIVCFDEAVEGADGLAYSRVVNRFVSLLSDMTRDGNLYRVDLRLRPYGKNGPNIVSKAALIDYIAEKASVWELLAYVQLRAVGGANADSIEMAAREAIANRAANEDNALLRKESRSMRLRLEETHGKTRLDREANIKFGPGGLLDVYFVVRYLQLTEGGKLPEDARSTSEKLAAFHTSGTLVDEDFQALSLGHMFLSNVDHIIRLTVGHSSRFPRSNVKALRTIAERMELQTPEELLAHLALHRINVRNAFDNILKP